MFLNAVKALLEGFLLRSLDERPVGLRYLEDLDEEDALSAIARPINSKGSNPLSASVNKISQQAVKDPAPAFSRAPQFTYSYNNFKTNNVFTAK